MIGGLTWQKVSHGLETGIMPAATAVGSSSNHLSVKQSVTMLADGEDASTAYCNSLDPFSVSRNERLAFDAHCWQDIGDVLLEC